MKKKSYVFWGYIFMFAVAINGALIIRIFNLNFLYILSLYIILFILGLICLFLLFKSKN
ncbi:hypothetical protein SAMN02745227_01267 [Anaerobranca californiensis DSM 14826]|uniref:Uncharacterized protein n=1 Tax=Anaerobranca californiensis DSM 14826 TaxID=1120989 RepID=A0A1M6NXP3_9FIRM|nr:hypothetical protein SAMN02745227_01267 [Anaerobranca californiensis DSM 14826]